MLGIDASNRESGFIRLQLGANCLSIHMLLVKRVMSLVLHQCYCGVRNGHSQEVQFMVKDLLNCGGTGSFEWGS